MSKKFLTRFFPKNCEGMQNLNANTLLEKKKTDINLNQNDFLICFIINIIKTTSPEISITKYNKSKYITYPSYIKDPISCKALRNLGIKFKHLPNLHYMDTPC